MPDKLIVMLGIDPASKEKGGISSVIDIYRAAGLFTRWPIHYIGTIASGSHAHKVRVALGALASFIRMLLSRRVALVHAQTASRASFWRKSIFMLLARAARVPVILHLHGAEFEHFYRAECGPIRKALVRYVLNGVDRVVVLSSQWRRALESIAPRARVETIVNPIPIPLEAPAPEARDPNVILFLGRFGKRKGIFDLLQAIALVKTRFPTVRLRCGGDGDIEGVRDRVRALGLEENVDVLGWVSGVEKERELMRAAIYVLPSYAEGLPMGVLEAMASGVPTISTEVGGIPDAIEDGVEGYLLRPGDVEGFADRIVRLLEDAALRARVGTAARLKAERVFGTDRVIAKVEDLYRSFSIPPRHGGNAHEPSVRKDADNSVASSA
jgi:glycosyltransferase involved in cell wall biosynthesis